MSLLAETLATALLLSGLAACSLTLLARTPPRVRFAIAAAGLAAWLVPWGALRVALPSTGIAPPPLVEWLGAAQTLAPTAAAAAVDDASMALRLVVAAAFFVGLALFARDCLGLRRCLRQWRARSRPAEELRALLPRELADVAAEIRLVEDSAVAAASGVLRPTVWIGERHTSAQRTLALAHELWHVRARDPAWLVLLAAVRRAYWWNPLVAYLVRQAVLMLESTCDHRCARQFGKADYVAELASLLLAARTPAPRLVATAGPANLDVQRLRLLREPLRLRARDLAVLAALGMAGAATATATVLERAPASAGVYDGIALPETPAGQALAALIGAANAGDSELLGQLLGAYTPQEVPMPLPRSSRVRVVEVKNSEPLRIRYVVESESGAQHLGELAVSVSATAQITATRLQPLQ